MEDDKASDMEAAGWWAGGMQPASPRLRFPGTVHRRVSDAFGKTNSSDA
jgi:hypothetical protein